MKFCILIFCVILLQAIAVFSNDNIEESSSLHVRRKRVIDNTRGGGRRIPLSQAPWIVQILKDERSRCAGIILENNIIIIPAFCIERYSLSNFTILSNSSLRYEGKPHRIENISFNHGVPFVLLKITPPVELQRGFNEKIELFLGAIAPNASGIFSGWGCTSRDVRIRDRFPAQLRQTMLPIITNERCEQFLFILADSMMCTYDETGKRSACNGDEGGPLVYSNRLLGMLIDATSTYENHLPDMFLNFNRRDVHNQINFIITELRAAP